MALSELPVTFLCVSDHASQVATAQVHDILTVESVYTTRLSSASKFLGC